MTKLWLWLVEWIASAVRAGIKKGLEAPVGATTPPESKALTEGRRSGIAR